MAVMCHNHVCDFVAIATPLYNVCKKGVPFEWGAVQKAAQAKIKEKIKNCFHMRNPRFPSEQPVVLAVDSSWHAVGYYMYQCNEIDPKEIYYIKFNLILMDPRQQQYSQPK
jgi:hypothetical protein